MRFAIAVLLSGALSPALGAQQIARAAAQSDLDYDGVGIAPDIVVPRTLDGVASGRDTQMAEAMRFLPQRISPERQR